MKMKTAIILLCMSIISCCKTNRNNLSVENIEKDIFVQTDMVEYVAYYDGGEISSIQYSIDYNDKSNRRFINSIHFFETGEISSINYFRCIPIENDTIYIQFYKSGKQQLIHTVVKDSFQYPQLSTWFFENGQIQSQGVNDAYKVWIVPFGLWKEYDSLGNLIKTTYYHPDEPEKDYIIMREYSNNKLISEKKYNNFVQYESDPIEK